MGRGFTASDAVRGAEAVVMLSDAAWTRPALAIVTSSAAPDVQPSYTR